MADLLVVELGKEDIVLGMQWLDTTGTIGTLAIIDNGLLEGRK